MHRISSCWHHNELQIDIKDITAYFHGFYFIPKKCFYMILSFLNVCFLLLNFLFSYHFDVCNHPMQLTKWKLVNFGELHCKSTTNYNFVHQAFRVSQEFVRNWNALKHSINCRRKLGFHWTFVALSMEILSIKRMTCMGLFVIVQCRWIIFELSREEVEKLIRRINL